MATVKDRRLGAVVGAFVADAAAGPLNWVYDDEKLQTIIGNKAEVEFWETSQNPFYRIPVGRNSCYGDQAYVVLKSLVDQKGVNCDDLKKATYDKFGPNSEYEDKDQKGEKDDGKQSLPIPRPWRNTSIKHFLANKEAGKQKTGSETDNQIDCVLRMVPVCAAYAGRKEMLQKVEEVVRVTQELELAVAIGLAAARILEKIILEGKGGEQVLNQVLTDLSNPKRLNPKEMDKTVAEQLQHTLGCLPLQHHVVITQKYCKD